MLAGFALSPNAFAAADVSKQAKKFMVHHERGHLGHHRSFAIRDANLDDHRPANRHARHLGGQVRR